MHSWVIVANTLLQTKLSHRESVNGLSSRTREKIMSAIKPFVWGGAKKKARIAWEVMLKHPKEGKLGVRDPVSTTNTRKITILRKIITKYRQLWMRHAERKITRVAKEWKVKKQWIINLAKNKLKT